MNNGYHKVQPAIEGEAVNCRVCEIVDDCGDLNIQNGRFYNYIYYINNKRVKNNRKGHILLFLIVRNLYFNRLYSIITSIAIKNIRQIWCIESYINKK